jgi:hypothetical protein
MSELEFYVCHAGQGIEQYSGNNDDGTGLGVIGCVYVWNGEWIRSPEECAGRDAMEIMRLISLSTGKTCWGSLDSFTPIDSNPWLINWVKGK